MLLSDFSVYHWKSHTSWRGLFHFISKDFMICDKDKNKCADSVLRNVEHYVQASTLLQKKKKKLYPNANLHIAFCSHRTVNHTPNNLYLLWKRTVKIWIWSSQSCRVYFLGGNYLKSSKFKTLLSTAKKKQKQKRKNKPIIKGENDHISLLDERWEQNIFRMLTMPIKPMSVISNGSISGIS